MLEQQAAYQNVQQQCLLYAGCSDALQSNIAEQNAQADVMVHLASADMCVPIKGDGGVGGDKIDAIDVAHTQP